MTRVAVVGAGPAGCAAALTLADAGLETVVFERGAPGKDKACGDALISPAVGLLAAMGIDAARLRALGGVPFTAIRNDGVVVQLREPGWNVPRARLDQELRDRAAWRVELRYGARILELDPLDAGGVELFVQSGGRERFDAVVLAEGASAFFARALGIDGSPVAAVSISGYAEGPDSGTIDFHYEPRFESGYGWVFSLGEGKLNAGVFLPPVARDLAASLFRDFMRERFGGRGGAPRGGALPLWSGKGSRWHHAAGVVSCGDAGALAHPRTGEGITAALESGLRAAEAVAAFLAGDRNQNELVDYSAWVRTVCVARYAVRAKGAADNGAEVPF